MTNYLKSPAELKKELPLSLAAKILLKQTKEQVQAIFNNSSDKKILLIGPCSIHSLEGAIEYAKMLESLQAKVHDKILILMRVHIEKPRTRNSWRGFACDPSLDGSYEIQKGIELSRSLMLSILELGLPITSEILDPLLSPYFDDLLSVGIIGARTVSSPIHRILASDLNFPSGFKNRIDGDINSAIEAIKIAQESHQFLGSDETGRLSIKNSPGNPNLFLVLRGGEDRTNYQKSFVLESAEKLKSNNLPVNILIDCSHGNKRFSSQEAVFSQVVEELLNDLTPIKGMILESYLSGGRFVREDIKNAPRNLSITDECLSFQKTEELVLNFYSKLIKSNHSLCL